MRNIIYFLSLTLFSCGVNSLPHEDMVVYDFKKYDAPDESMYEEYYPPEENYSPYGPIILPEPSETSDKFLNRYIQRPRPSPPPCVVCGMVK